MVFVFGDKFMKSGDIETEKNHKRAKTAPSKAVIIITNLLS